MCECILLVVLYGVLFWDLFLSNESDGSLRVLDPVAVNCHNDSLDDVPAV